MLFRQLAAIGGSQRAPHAAAGGEALGNELVIGGDFASASGWSLGGFAAGATISGGKLRGDNNDFCWCGRTAAETITPGTYRVVYTIDTRITGTVRVWLGAASAEGSSGGQGPGHSAVGTFTDDVVVSSVAGQFIVIQPDSTNAVIDNFSVKRVN